MNSTYHKVFKFVFIGLVALGFQNVSKGGQQPLPNQHPAHYVNKYQSYYDYNRSQSWYVDVDSIYNPVTGESKQVRTTDGQLGLGIYDDHGTEGAGIISESQGYALILAALYDDETTFRRLSATVQAALQWGNTGKNLTGSPTGLFPWFLSYKSDKVYQIAYNSSIGGYDANSASDADVNIGIAYVMAGMLYELVEAGVSKNNDGTCLYNLDLDWRGLTDDGYVGYVNEFGEQPYVGPRAADYIGQIYLKDFVSNSSASLANRRILTDGAAQAAQGNIYNWHPDYSDPRAFQLFGMFVLTAETVDEIYYEYEQYGVLYSDINFWTDVLKYTKASWMALFDFGSTDTRTTWTSAPPTGQDISASTKNVFLNNATFGAPTGALTFNSDYKQVKASRYQTAYDSDSCRMPVRQMNYIKAYQNWGDVEMAGIANSALEALGTSYTNSGYSYLTSNINIWTPWSQWYSYGVQDFMGSGLYAYAGNPAFPYSNRATVLQELETDFGTDGLNGTVSAPSTGYNALITLWNLTTTYGGETLVQEAYEDYVVAYNAEGVYYLMPEWVRYESHELDAMYSTATKNSLKSSKGLEANRSVRGNKISSHPLSICITRSSDLFIPEVIGGKYKLSSFAGSPFQRSGSLKSVHCPSSIDSLTYSAFDGSAVKEVYYYGAPPVVVGSEHADGLTENHPAVYYSALKSGWPSSFMESQTTPFLDVAPGMTIPNFLPAKRSGVLNYKVSGLPYGLRFDRVTGAISGRLGYIKPGKYDVTVTENMNKKSLKANDYKIRFVVYKSRAELESKSISPDSKWWTVLKVVSIVLPIFSPF